MEKQRNVILGAGLSGLSVAYHLQEDSAIYDKLDRIGGLTRSEHINGFTFDYAPHILFTVTPYTVNLIQQLLKDNLTIKQREAYIYHMKYDLYTRFPYQAHLFGLPQEAVLECLKELYKAIKEYDSKEPQNYEEWIYARFGKGIADQLMIPYAHKLWTVSPSMMNFEWIARRVPEPNYERILEGALTDIAKREGFNNEFWYPIEGGIEALPTSLAKGIKNINLNKTVTKIIPAERIVEFNSSEQVAYERLVSTLPLPDVINMIDNVPADVKAAADNLEYNSITCVNIGVNRANISPYHWLYFHEPEFLFHRISFPMNVSDKTAPIGRSSVSCEIAHSRHRALPVSGEKEIIQRTIDDLVKAKILRADDAIEAAQVLPIKYAYIIYDLNHRKNVSTIHSYLKSQNIYPCGRFGEWEYFNMDHSILSGKRMVDTLNELDAITETSR